MKMNFPLFVLDIKQYFKTVGSFSRQIYTDRSFLVCVLNCRGGFDFVLEVISDKPGMVICWFKWMPSDGRFIFGFVFDWWFDIDKLINKHTHTRRQTYNRQSAVHSVFSFNYIVSLLSQFSLWRLCVFALIFSKLQYLFLSCNMIATGSRACDQIPQMILFYYVFAFVFAFRWLCRRIRRKYSVFRSCRFYLLSGNNRTSQRLIRVCGFQ